MPAHRKLTRPEPTTRAGEILLSHNHIALLHGLYDRPDGYAESQNEWIRASLPHVERFREHPCRWALYLAIRTLHPSWAIRSRRGNRIEARLAPRGRAILERTLPARIRGRGTYEGLRSVKREQRTPLPTAPRPGIGDEIIRKAVEFSNSYGIPLLPVGIDRRNHVTLFAVSSGLDRSFSLKSQEELSLRGIRFAHTRWTQWAVESNQLPDGYRAAFQDYDEEDLLCYLKEQLELDAGKNVYCRTYGGRTFLSEEKLVEWLREDIDFTETDIPLSELPWVARASSATYGKAKQAIKDAGVLAWAHPDTGRPAGRAFGRVVDSEGNRDLFVSSCAALSCLQAHFDLLGLGIRLETRYVDA